MIAAWFIPRSVELRVRQHPGLLRVVYRISRFTPGAGVVLDWLTVTRRRPPGIDDIYLELVGNGDRPGTEVSDGDG